MSFDDGFTDALHSQSSPARGYERNYVRFYRRPILDELATNGGLTALAGKTQEVVDRYLAEGATIIEERDGSKSLRIPAAGRPIYRNEEYVTIQVPGDKTNILDKPVTDVERQRYSKQYAAFKAEKNQDEASGTLLTAWAGIPPERAEEYAFFNVKTVEQLAGMSDANLQRMGHGALKERQRAEDYLKTMAGYAPTAELRKQNEQMSDELQAMRRQMEEMQAALAEHRRNQALTAQIAGSVSSEPPTTTKRARQ